MIPESKKNAQNADEMVEIVSQPNGETYSPKNLWEFKASPIPMPTMPGKNASFSSLTMGFWW